MEKSIRRNSDSRCALVDYLKGFSMLTIVIFHLISSCMLFLPNSIKVLANFGGAGVHVFVLCSGFGLYYSYLGKKVTVGAFYKKRLVKIYVPYIIIVLISAMFPFMYSGHQFWAALLSHVFLFKMFVPRFEVSFGQQLWFISTIIQFYIIFPLLIKLKSKTGRHFFNICLLISFLWWVLVALIDKSQVRVWNSFFLQYLWEFALGMEFAGQFHAGKQSIQVNRYAVFLISILCIAIYGFMGLHGGMWKLFNDIPALIGYGGFLTFIYMCRIPFINQFFIKISTFSYEWYLVHILVFDCTMQALQNHMPGALLAILALFLSVLTALVYHRLLKQFLPVRMRTGRKKAC